MQTEELTELTERIERVYQGAALLVSRLEALQRNVDQSGSEKQEMHVDSESVAALSSLSAKLVEVTQLLGAQTIKMIEASRNNITAARQMLEAAQINDAAALKQLEAARLMNTASVRNQTRRT